MKFSTDDWHTSSEIELYHKMQEYALQFGGFDPSHFCELNFHLLKDTPKKEHLDYLSELYEYGPCGTDDIPEHITKFVDTTKFRRMFSFSTPSDVAFNFPEMTLNDVENVLASTIAKDRTTKLITFMAMLLTYTEQEQTGILFQSGSSTGKSHNALEVASYFPREDIIAKDYASPTAFFHKQSTLCLRKGDMFYPLLTRDIYVDTMMKQWDDTHPAPEERGTKTAHSKLRNTILSSYRTEWDELEKVWFWDLSRKVVLFKDMPHDFLLRNLRPLISKDKRTFEADITDKNASGQHATKSVVLKGYSTFIFCSASYSQDEQERTRFFLLSPDVEQEKIMQGIKMSVKRSCDRANYEDSLASNTDRELLRERIKAIKMAHIDDVKIPNVLEESILSRVNNGEIPQPRVMRDVVRIIALMKAHALLNFTGRERHGNVITAEDRDVIAGFELYDPIAKATERGVPPQVWAFYETALLPALCALSEEDDSLGITRKEFSKLWFEYFNERLGHRREQEILWLMDSAGLIYECPDPDDKRRMIINATALGVERKKNDGHGQPKKHISHPDQMALQAKFGDRIGGSQ